MLEKPYESQRVDLVRYRQKSQMFYQYLVVPVAQGQLRELPEDTVESYVYKDILRAEANRIQEE